MEIFEQSSNQYVNIVIESELILFELKNFSYCLLCFFFQAFCSVIVSSGRCDRWVHFINAHRTIQHKYLCFEFCLNSRILEKIPNLILCTKEIDDWNVQIQSSFTCNPIWNDCQIRVTKFVTNLKSNGVWHVLTEDVVTKIK